MAALALRYPMKCEVFEKRFPKHIRKIKDGQMVFESASLMSMKVGAADMGLAPGGRMRQEIYKDPFKLSDWEMDQRSRCFVHLTNSLVWRAIIGDAPSTVPFTAKDYNDLGLPWFDFYSDNSIALKGSEKLKGLKSVVELGKEKRDNPLPENESVDHAHIMKLPKRLKKGQVREGEF